MQPIEILAIEDSSTDLFWLKSVLSEIGIEHRLSVAVNGQQAVDFLLKRGEYSEAPEPDLIFLDVHMPMLTGLEVLRQVPDAHKLPICVLTGSNAERELFRKEFGIGSSNYLTKPLTREGLVGCLRCHKHLQELAEVLPTA
jgi:CheY-like chemotaxis protein